MLHSKTPINATKNFSEVRTLLRLELKEFGPRGLNRVRRNCSFSCCQRENLRDRFAAYESITDETEREGDVGRSLFPARKFFHAEQRTINRAGRMIERKGKASCTLGHGREPFQTSDDLPWKTLLLLEGERSRAT